MAGTVLTISGRGQRRQVELDPAGTIVGRSTGCDVVIDSRDVSRRHVRIFWDPAGQWIFEDLGRATRRRRQTEPREPAARERQRRRLIRRQRTLHKLPSIQFRSVHDRACNSQH